MSSRRVGTGSVRAKGPDVRMRGSMASWAGAPAAVPRPGDPLQAASATTNQESQARRTKAMVPRRAASVKGAMASDCVTRLASSVQRVPLEGAVTSTDRLLVLFTRLVVHVGREIV